MRTSIVLDLDETLVREAMQYANLRTKRALVEQCLRSFIAAGERDRRAATYRQRLLRVQAVTRPQRLRESAATIIRRYREAQ